MSTICVEHLKQKFGRVIALNDVSVSIERGEIVGLIGSSGAGKTTLLRVLSTFMAPSSGTVTLNGVDVTSDSLRVRRMVGYLPEKDPIYPEIRVIEYLTFRAKLRGLFGRTRSKRLREVISRCGLAGLEKALMGKLSKGEVRRVLLADCLAGEPEIVLLDEPTLGLDPLNAGRLKTMFASLRGEHTVVFSTHDMAEAEALCTRVLLLHRGAVMAYSPPSELLCRYGVDSLGAVLKIVAAGGVS